MSHGTFVSERETLITESSKSSRKVFNAIQAQCGASVEVRCAAVVKEKLGSFLRKKVSKVLHGTFVSVGESLITESTKLNASFQNPAKESLVRLGYLQTRKALTWLAG